MCVVVQFSCNFCIECYDGCFVSRLVRGMGDGVGHRRYASLASTSGLLWVYVFRIAHNGARKSREKMNGWPRGRQAS